MHISESTRLAVANGMVTRPIDNVAVQGKEQGILVHELMRLVLIETHLCPRDTGLEDR